MKTSQEGDLRVWWTPQVPCPSFRVSVKTIDEAILLLTTLAEYDRFQFNIDIRDDYCNMGGLEVQEDGERVEWHHPDTDQDIDEIMAT